MSSSTTGEEENALRAELTARVRDDPEFFEFMLESSQDGVWFWDLEAPEGAWTQPKYWTAFGQHRAQYDYLTRNWHDVVHPEDVDALTACARRHFDDPNHPLDQVIRYRDEQGETVWLRVRGRAVRDAAGRAIRLVGSHADITPLQRARESLEVHNAELEAVNRELSALAHAVSHDVRSPLRSLASLMRLVLEDVQGKVSNDVDKTLRVALQSAERIHGVVDGIYQSAVLNASKPATEVVDLDALVKDVVEGLGVATDGAQLEVGALPTVTCSPVLARQVVHNLLENALKFRRSGVEHRVEVSGAAGRGGAWEVSVRDNGVGIDAANVERVFNPFVRLHTQAEFSGAGIGLALVRRGVELLGGTIEVTSELGRGTEMVVRVAADAGLTSAET